MLFLRLSVHTYQRSYGLIIMTRSRLSPFFDQITPATAEDKKMPTEGVLRQNLLSQNRKTVEPLAHVGLAGRKPNPRMARDRDHSPASERTSRHIVSLSRQPFTETRCPLAKVISIEEASETLHSIASSLARGAGSRGSETSTGKNRSETP